ncbi:MULTISPECIES: DUF3192 domain-containing protein [unclassified Arsukibacterium]|uniref:DUF3192 domain-containing protein n=1 Tax=unclassified Arsukibacterium TaxID=2635278 RepID=UPI000C8F1B21|nr:MULTISPECIES: DUF3192 domain-containing protein [unclassified Arsukibacterium]MAA95695.1 hypothetical protein [Rheinheimera sp.]HAW92651.1 hypothetical protein [Candidatus Azambacteria bacterium]|tara:strand:- start:1233 stop:1601 length:369 start_codon:yes stop_codon:yes gene_type:complete
MIVKSLSLLIAASLLTGCVVAIGDKDYEDGDSADSEWRSTQQANLTQINQLQPGIAFSQVVSRMGNPDFTEYLVKDTQQVQVLFYRTQHKRSDGKTTKDECTPLVFIDGQLHSWGDKAYQQL